MISGALPNKFFDAIGSLTPILAVGNGDVADMVKKYDLGWCVDNNVEKIKNCLINISKNAIEQKVINIKKIKNKFMRQNLLKEYLNIVQNI